MTLGPPVVVIEPRSRGVAPARDLPRPSCAFIAGAWLRCGRGFDSDAVYARVAVVEEDDRGTFDLSEIAGGALSIGGALVLRQRFALVVDPDNPAPCRGRFNVDG
jgi:hypothetical protein